MATTEQANTPNAQKARNGVTLRERSQAWTLIFCVGRSDDGSRGRLFMIGRQYLLGVGLRSVHTLVGQMHRVDEIRHALRPGVGKKRPDIVIGDQPAARRCFIDHLLELDRAVAEDIGVGGLRGGLSAGLVLMLRKIAFELLGRLFDRGFLPASRPDTDRYR